jgi:hypothetical protein
MDKNNPQLQYTMKKKTLTLVTIILALTIITLVNAELRLTLLTPQVTFHKIVGDNANYFISVENRNSFDVKITLKPDSDLNMQFDSPTEFILAPNESKIVNYNITITKSGNYSNSIAVQYTSSEDNSTFALSQAIVFFVDDVQQTPTQSVSSDSSSSSSGGGGSISSGTKKTQNATFNTSVSSTVSDVDTCKGDTCSLNSNETVDTHETVTANEQTFLQKYWVYIVIILIVLIIVIISFLINKKNKSSQTIEIEDVSSDVNATNEDNTQVTERG